ncbi:MAG: ABC-F family ATP-binding cassette domain-containing protein [Lachnospiraceae bacterium]|nr:ABC-F family ATP-binding cassette domain-containing protein [Lachnospiraceae bacterium]MDD6505475.1 ABC-F family ATP-binding cassette domain-containing protein [Lachnospiraceae bacterium]
MLYQIVNGSVSIGGQTILSHINFEIKGSEKIAVVGRNGAGKTTLLRLIAGELETDRDDKCSQPTVQTSRNLTVGMLRQVSDGDLEKTVEELLLESCRAEDPYSRERFLYEVEYDRIFVGFGFAKEDKQKKLREFSGGEQTKIQMIRLLLQKPDILLLDEPTNHLDVESVEWLEEYFRRYNKAVVFVSHDRFFLDRVVSVVYELEGKKTVRYVGNYTAYREQKRDNIRIQKKKYESQQAEIARLNELIVKFKNKPSKAAFARSRKSILERMEKVEPPREDNVHIFTGPIQPEVSGSKWVLEAEHLKIGYDKPLSEISARIRRGQKIGVVGANGVGKTTFLKTVAGLLEPLSGDYSMGNHILMGYFDQQTAAMDSTDRVIEHFRRLFPVMTEKDCRQTLGAYLFRGQDCAKRVKDLSGGEKSRLVLCELLTSKPNFLVLDEPTNHMDIPAKETLESAFRAYTGTMLFVSHDRYFISRVADALLIFEDQNVLYYPFGYEHYLQRKKQGQGEDMAALVAAKDQALVADLKAVPKAERHRLREMGTEEAYRDWKLRLAREPMERAAEEYERQYEEWMFLMEPTEEETRKVEQALDAWTEECVQWFSIYNTI